MSNPLLIGTLSAYLSESVLVIVIGAVVLLRVRRYRAVGGAAIGAVSSAVTVGVGVLVVLFGLVALGYWEPPIVQIVGDALGAGRAVYDLVGEWVVRQTVERLEEVAAA